MTQPHLFGGGVVRISPNLKKTTRGFAHNHSGSRDCFITRIVRAPRRGNELTAQGKRAKRAAPWVGPKGFRYAPGGGKSNDRRTSATAFAPSGGASLVLLA